ncbi:MAG: sugar transferase [Gemmatimonadota bacterium]|nr:sugar transferase [Gemmatimonadota bacterium]MDE3006143.1 sugar transferase [Gemmatimonadota bacterium]MDE3013665.1 sugar transferase [Gemmatimonadota bacterium]
MKRFFDILGSSVLLVGAVPLLAVIAVAARLGSGAPVFFRHERIGRDGRSFECLKFRTMVVDAEEWLERDETLARQHREEGFKLSLRDDPRITSIGRLLRRTQLDELPQLWNVLVGDMSLVGPRPLVTEELEWFTEDERRRLLSVRPGIFGPWTAKGRRRPGYPERAQLDLSYTDCAGPARDFRLLLAHVPVVLRGQGDDT